MVTNRIWDRYKKHSQIFSDVSFVNFPMAAGICPVNSLSSISIDKAEQTVRVQIEKRIIFLFSQQVKDKNV